MFLRSLYLHPDFEAGKVNTIITLATPHRPVIVTDWDLHKFYEDVNLYWKLNNETKLSHVTLVSIGGGFRDTQVILKNSRTE
jgi:glycosylphosphatidylinositol deacylase